MTVLIRDVTLRDGLQDEQPISTDAKVALYSALVLAGVPELELTSFVRADRVPAMADAESLTTRTTDGGPIRWGLVLNLRGVERALAVGLRHLQFVVSVSEEHNHGNAGCDVDRSFLELGHILDRTRDVGATVEVTLATAFGCPHIGPVAPDAVRSAATRAIDLGAASIGLADTVGTALPHEVSHLVAVVGSEHPSVPLGVHLHDTRGLAIANALAGIEAGATRVDGSVGGLGGCPFAPGASGNLALEDLVHALDEMGVETGISLDRLLDAGRLACDLVGKPVSGHVAVAGRRFERLADRGV